MEKVKRLSAVTFSLGTFFPVCFLLLLVVPGLVLNGLISVPAPYEQHPARLFFPLLAVALMTYYFFLFNRIFRRYTAAGDFKKRFLVMYIGWLAALFPILFLFMSSLGGASMAVADGAAGSYAARLPGYLSMTCMFMLGGHIVFVPWILLANWFFVSQYRLQS